MGAGAAKSSPSRKYALPYGWNMTSMGVKLSFFFDFLWISHQDTLRSLPFSRSAGLRPCFATCFWHFPMIFSGFLIKICTSQYLSPAQLAFGHASLPVSIVFLGYFMDFSSRYGLISTSLPLSRPSAVLRYLFLSFLHDFLWISDHDIKCTMHHAPWTFFVFLLIKKL